MPNYVEVCSEQNVASARRYTYVFDRVLIKLNREFTSPAKTLAIVAHNEDFDYDNLPLVVREIATCQTIEQVLELSAVGQLPAICRTSEDVSKKYIILF